MMLIENGFIKDQNSKCKKIFEWNSKLFYKEKIASIPNKIKETRVFMVKGSTKILGI
jgi:hypothetical protein